MGFDVEFTLKRRLALKDFLRKNRTIWAFSKGPCVPRFGKVILLRIQGFRFGDLEGSARYLC